MKPTLVTTLSNNLYCVTLMLISLHNHFLSIKPVSSDHLSYVTIFHCSLGRSHKTGLTVDLRSTVNMLTFSDNNFGKNINFFRLKIAKNWYFCTNCHQISFFFSFLFFFRLGNLRLKYVVYKIFFVFYLWIQISLKYQEFEYVTDLLFIKKCFW